MGTQYIINNSDNLLTGQTINGELNVTSAITVNRFYSENTNTGDISEIILEPIKFEATNTSNGVGKLISTYNYLLGSNIELYQENVMGGTSAGISSSVSNNGVYTFFGVSGFPNIAYANQTILLTQDSTTGLGQGWSHEVTFDSNGDIASLDPNWSPGYGYIVGDQITTNDPGSGAFVIEISAVSEGSILTQQVVFGNKSVTFEVRSEPNDHNFYLEVRDDDTSEVTTINVDPTEVTINTPNLVVTSAVTASTFYGDGSNLSGVTSTLPYKVYTALLTQSGTDAPVATVLENTLEGTPVWYRTGTGNYFVELIGAFTSNKTIIINPSNNESTGGVLGPSIGVFGSGIDSGEDSLYLTTGLQNVTTGEITASDNVLYVGGIHFIEIRVYP